MPKLTVEVTPEQQAALHKACPELFEAPVENGETIIETDPGRNNFHIVLGVERQKVYVRCGRSGHITAPLTPTQARQAARALIVAAGQLEGREPKPTDDRRLADATTNPWRLEKFILGYLDRLLYA